MVYKYINFWDALKALARERPKNPIEFFSYYLLT